ncbi:MAG: biotin--[acetyl-CoA-carboxylase] ligase [Bacteroidales bacterium]|nr:biotin--[acetyl-CoA-carboxylase] ligase [Bacteroidales bacterium]
MIIGTDVRHFEKVSSTNSVAAGLLRETVPAEGSVITASYQESGRGQQGNIWESEPRKNLIMSVIIYPVMVRPADQFVISRMVSLAVHDLVSLHTTEARIKWPNDIYAGNDKIAGILIENSIMGETLGTSIAGIGLNVNQTVFRSDAPNPVSLKQITGRDHDLEAITGELISFLDKRYKMVIRGDVSMLEEEYHALLFRAGAWHKFSDCEGIFEGMIERVMPDGMLSVRKRNNVTRQYAFREIDYIL